LEKAVHWGQEGAAEGESAEMENDPSGEGDGKKEPRFPLTANLTRSGVPKAAREQSFFGGKRENLCEERPTRGTSGGAVRSYF